jgi:hypothetical protein
MTGADLKVGDVRRTTLSVGVTLQAETWLVYGGGGGVTATYRGSIADLLMAGALTPAMLSNVTGHRSGRRQCDEHGKPFRLHRSATKALPERMRLIREGEPAYAMQLPGVRDLFPEGIAEPAQAEPVPARQRPVLRIVVNNEFAGGCTP